MNKITKTNKHNSLYSNKLKKPKKPSSFFRMGSYNTYMRQKQYQNLSGGEIERAKSSIILNKFLRMFASLIIDFQKLKLNSK
jgi:hypothetical protein